MPLRLQPLRLGQPPMLHSVLRAPSSYSIPLSLRLQRRTITADEKPLPKADQAGLGPNQDQLPHVSEEAAATGKITGEGGPDMEQGTPVQEILQRDKDNQEQAPKVIQDEWKSSPSKGSRPFSTSTRRHAEELLASKEDPIEPLGHIFELPGLPLPSKSHIKHRYDPVVKQVTNLIMKDGKLSKAQRNMSLILQYLRTAPPPLISPDKPLIRDAPPASLLPLNPTLYLELVIDSVSPLFRIRNQKGAAGGGASLSIPIPLGVRQRRRRAVSWILDAASKRKTEGSGHGGFARKVAKELIAIAEGRSTVWERRNGVHRQGISARTNLKFRKR